VSQLKPALFIIAGPLGAGKTTFYEAYLKEAFPMLLPAARDQRQRFLNEQRSFAVDDIRVDMQLLDEAKAAGYTTKVLFISTEDANLNVGRGWCV
jgi:predicted ABC-type ATPase